MPIRSKFTLRSTSSSVSFTLFFIPLSFLDINIQYLKSYLPSFTSLLISISIFNILLFSLSSSSSALCLRAALHSNSMARFFPSFSSTKGGSCYINLLFFLIISWLQCRTLSDAVPTNAEAHALTMLLQTHRCTESWSLVSSGFFLISPRTFMYCKQPYTFISALSALVVIITYAHAYANGQPLAQVQHFEAITLTRI